jgi:hypothetical protein
MDVIVHLDSHSRRFMLLVLPVAPPSPPPRLRNGSSPWVTPRPASPQVINATALFITAALTYVWTADREHWTTLTAGDPKGT